ncbi:MAG: ISAs1 family transposase [Methylococcales bacterium]
MKYKLEDFIHGLQDPRRGQGQRHKLSDVLSMVIMAILSGYQGLKGFARFAAANQTELVNLLDLKHGVPCFFTFRAILNGLDEHLLAQRFTEWVKTYEVAGQETYIALDGKAVSGSSSGGNTSLQNFIAVVSAFGHQSGLVYGMNSFENGKSGEAQALRDLVEQLGLKDKVFTMDALHAQKNA